MWRAETDHNEKRENRCRSERDRLQKAGKELRKLHGCIMGRRRPGNYITKVGWDWRWSNHTKVMVGLRK